MHCVQNKQLRFIFVNNLVTIRTSSHHTSWVALISPTDRPKSVRNLHVWVIEVFVGVYILLCCIFWCPVGIGASVIDKSQIFSFFIQTTTTVLQKGLISVYRCSEISPFFYDNIIMLCSDGFVTLQFVIITQFVIHYKLRWIATQFVIHRISNCVVRATRFVMYYKLHQNFII